MTMHLNSNNLSDVKSPGKDDGAWSRENMGSGVRTIHSGGITYMASGYESKWELKGGVDASSTKIIGNSATTQRWYYDVGDRFIYSWNNSTNRNISARTNHEFYTKLGNRANITFTPSFNYEKQRGHKDYLSAYLNGEVDSLTKSLLNNIYDGNHDEVLKILVNRNNQRRKTNGTTISANAGLQSNIKLKSSGLKNLIALTAGIQYTNKTEEEFSLYRVNYSENPTATTNQNQYFENYPHRDFSMNAGVNFKQFTDDSGQPLSFAYEFKHSEQTRTQNMYNLVLLDEDYGFGNLPSVNEYRPTLSAVDSYSAFTVDNEHRLVLSMDNKTFKIGKRQLLAHLNIPLIFLHRTYDYNGRNIKEHVTRKDIFPEIDGYAWLFLGRSWSIQTIFSSNVQRMNMIDLMPVIDATDPLYIKIGNPDLKNARKNYFNLAVIKYATNAKHAIAASYSFTDNAIAQGQFVDMKSGIRKVKKYNLDGNWSGDAHYKLSTYFDRNQRFSLDSDLSGIYQHSVDLSGTASLDENLTPPKREMNTISVKEEFKLNWQNSNYRVSLNANATYNHYQSPDKNFVQYSSWICSYGASSVLKLPKNWGFSTDLMLYTRRGFTDSKLNTTDLVWNARLTKSILNGNLMFVIDGYDILHQLSNVTYTVNAQARTEVVSNVIPSYVLFHVQWRFNRQPKR